MLRYFFRLLFSSIQPLKSLWSNERDLMEPEELCAHCLSMLEEEEFYPDFQRVQPAVLRLCEDNLVTFNPNGEELTDNTWRYLFIVSQHRDPLGAANLLSSMSCFGFLDERYPALKDNLNCVKNTVFPQEIAYFLDRVYRFLAHISLARFQHYFDALCALTETECLNLTTRMISRMESSSELTFEQFEDELHLVTRARNANRQNLSALAHDVESATKPLTFIEERRLERAMTYYMPYVEKMGIDACYNTLLDHLIGLYQQHPLSFRKSASSLTASASFFDTVDVQLPLTWKEFQDLPLTEAERQRALQLYYKDPVHTAYRFFNEIDAAGPWLVNKQYWQSFASYKPLLAMLWAAVTDKDTSPIDDYTLEGRIQHFIESFAEYRRAHNQDKRRECSGRPGKYEFYDDGEEDKPGCLLAFRQRAFDSVQGHPLFKVLSEQLLWREVCDRVTIHFKKRLETKCDKRTLSQLVLAWQAVLNAEKADFKILARLNVSRKLQRQWLSALKEKYVDLRESPILKEKYYKWFKLERSFLTHAETFGGAVLLDKLLEIAQKNRCWDSSIAAFSLLSYPVPNALLDDARMDTDARPTHSHEGLSFSG